MWKVYLLYNQLLHILPMLKDRRHRTDSWDKSTTIIKSFITLLVVLMIVIALSYISFNKVVRSFPRTPHWQELHALGYLLFSSINFLNCLKSALVNKFFRIYSFICNRKMTENAITLGKSTTEKHSQSHFLAFYFSGQYIFKFLPVIILIGLL